MKLLKNGLPGEIWEYKQSNLALGCGAMGSCLPRAQGAVWQAQAPRQRAALAYRKIFLKTVRFVRNEKYRNNKK